MFSSPVGIDKLELSVPTTPPDHEVAGPHLTGTAANNLPIYKATFAAGRDDQVRATLRARSAYGPPDIADCDCQLHAPEREFDTYQYFAHLACNPSRHKSVRAIQLADLEYTVTAALPSVLAGLVDEFGVAGGCLRAAIIKRVDLSVDFIGCAQPHAFLNALAALAAPHAPLAQRAAHRAGTGLVSWGTGGSRMVTAYDRHDRRPELVAQGTIRVEFKLWRKWLTRNTKSRHPLDGLGDLTTRWIESTFGQLMHEARYDQPVTLYPGIAAGLLRAENAGWSPRKLRSHAGQLLMDMVDFQTPSSSHFAQEHSAFLNDAQLHGSKLQVALAHETRLALDLRTRRVVEVDRRGRRVIGRRGASVLVHTEPAFPPVPGT